MPEYNNVLGTIFYIVTAYNKLAFDQELSSPLHALQAFDLSYIFFKYQNETKQEDAYLDRYSYFRGARAWTSHCSLTHFPKRSMP